METALNDLLVGGASSLGVGLPDDALRRFSIYHSLLQEWGRKINLTSRLGDREIVLHHFLDSLSGVNLVADPPSARLIDIGSGAGFPAIPLKIVLGDLRAVIVESSRKKVSFCRHVIRETALSGIEVEWGRGEVIAMRPEYRAAFDWAVSRAVGRGAAVAEIAMPFLASGGRILLYKGSPQESELEEIERYCLERGATWTLHSLLVPGLREARSHIVIRKASAGHEP